MPRCRYCQSAQVIEYSPSKWKCSQCGRLVTRPETKYCSDECEEKAK